MKQKKQNHIAQAPESPLEWGDKNPLIARKARGWRSPGGDGEWDIELKLIGNRISTARNSCGYSRNGMSKALGVSYTNYMKWERGETEPSLYYTTTVARVCGVSLDWLVLGKGQREQIKTAAEGNGFEVTEEELEGFDL